MCPHQVEDNGWWEEHFLMLKYLSISEDKTSCNLGVITWITRERFVIWRPQVSEATEFHSQTCWVSAKSTWSVDMTKVEQDINCKLVLHFRGTLAMIRPQDWLLKFGKPQAGGCIHLFLILTVLFFWEIFKSWTPISFDLLFRGLEV